MKHPFIRKAKKNSYLMDLIDRHRKWKMTRGEESESDSDGESAGEPADDPDTDWIMTVKVGFISILYIYFWLRFGLTNAMNDY